MPSLFARAGNVMFVLERERKEKREGKNVDWFIKNCPEPLSHPPPDLLLHLQRAGNFLFYFFL